MNCRIRTKQSNRFAAASTQLYDAECDVAGFLDPRSRSPLTDMRRLSPGIFPMERADFPMRESGGGWSLQWDVLCRRPIHAVAGLRKNQKHRKEGVRAE